MTTEELLAGASAARSHAPAAFRVMAAELRARNPQFTVTLAQDDAVDDTSTVLATSAKGTKTRTVSEGGISDVDVTVTLALR